MAGLYDKLNDKDKEVVKSWGRAARESRYNRDIPPELFIAAKLGMYYGWEARVAFGRGYVIGIDDSGKLIKIPYTFDEAVADVKAADKVRYRRIIEDSDIQAAANLSINSPKYAKSIVDYSNKIRREVNE